jgi:heme oxygenase
LGTGALDVAPYRAMTAPLNSALAALRSATTVSHQRLEKRLDIKTRFTGLAAYRAHLEKMWGFCAALEEPLRPESFGGALPDYEIRRKLPLLTQDLLAIGMESAELLSLERCIRLPAHLDAAAAFGCTYVMEGATLGGRTLLPLVEDRLGFTPDRGAAYLGSYRDNVAGMWRDFGAAVDDWCDRGERRESAARAAVMTFDALTEWLCGDHG